MSTKVEIDQELQELYRECMSHWGFEAQANVAQEECAELITAISHLRRGRQGGIEEVIEECADVYLILNQLMEYVGRSTVMNVVKFKADRTRVRLNNDKQYRIKEN